MEQTASRRAPVMARTDRARLAFLTSTHVVDDLYQGAVPALLPFLAIERHYSYAGLTGITLAADRCQRIGTLRLGCGLAAVAVLLLVAAPGVAVLFIAVCLLGIVLFAPFAVQVTLGQVFLPNLIGIASGVTLGLAVSVGGVAAPAVRAAGGHPWPDGRAERHRRVPRGGLRPHRRSSRPAAALRPGQSL